MSVITFVIAACTSALLTWLLGFWLIPFLRKLKYGQTILDIGPKWHAKREGTPTMGGIMFIIAAVMTYGVGMIIFAANGMDLEGAYKREFVVSAAGMVMAVLFGAMGFLDDLLKVKKKENEGLKPIQKIIFQVLIIAAYFATVYISGFEHTAVSFPWGAQWDMGVFYYPVMGLGILYIVNAVNLTDGIDGLCSSVTLVYCAVFAVIASMKGMFGGELMAFCAGGGCVGFLVWNFHPARVFMGDTGSMFLGGIVCALGVGCASEFLMIIAGLVYILEALSVIIQTTIFKITKKMYGEGRRFFKMTPIHHHFELCKWSEYKICAVFSLTTAALGALAAWWAYVMFR